MNYEIKILGKLDESWSAWLGDVKITSCTAEDGSAMTLLTGTAPDQPALFGILNHIRDLNLTLVSVRQTDEDHLCFKKE